MNQVHSGNVQVICHRFAELGVEVTPGEVEQQLMRDAGRARGIANSMACTIATDGEAFDSFAQHFMLHRFGMNAAEAIQRQQIEAALDRRQVTVLTYAMAGVVLLGLCCFIAGIMEWLS